MTKKQRVYIKEVLEAAVRESKSISEVARRLGISDRGGNRKTIKNKIQQFGIDCSHFTGQSWAKGQTADTSDPIRRVRIKLSYSDDEVFVQNSKYSGSGKLASRLLRMGWDYICQECGLSEWREKQLTLHVDHINGIPDDHRLENLRFLCPNCHQQTETWGSQKRGKNFSNKLLLNEQNMLIKQAQLKSSTKNSNTTFNPQHQQNNCSHCGKAINNSNQHIYCSMQCFNLVSRRVVRPSKEELEKMIWTQPTIHVARHFGVSDKAVEKWCKTYGVEKPPRGYWAKKQSSKNQNLLF